MFLHFYGARKRLSRAIFPSITMEYIQTFYREAEKKVMGSSSSGNVWIENNSGNAELFVVLFSFFSQNGDEAEVYSAGSVSCACYLSQFVC